MPLVNKRAILETLERRALERLVVLTMEQREDYQRAVYGRNPLFDDALEGERVDPSAPLADGELVEYIMRDRLIGAYDVIMALHAPELRRTCTVLGVWDRGGRKAELRDHLRDALGTTVERPVPAEIGADW